MHASVDNSLLYRLQAFLSADDQLTQGQDEIRLQGNRVIFLRVVRIDVHGVDVLRAGRADLDDLPFKPLYQSCIFCLRIADDDIVIRHQEGIGHFTLGTEGFTGARCSEDQAVRVFQELSVHHDQVVGNGIQPVIQGFFSILEQLLRRERNHDARRTAGHLPLNADQILRQRKTRHQCIFLLEIQPAQVAVIFLSNTGCLEIVRLQLLRRPSCIHHQN